MIEAIAALVGLLVIGAWLLLHHREPERDSRSRIVRRIDEILPQTQCQQCGYGGCLPYAQAILSGNAPIDQCPPGGPVVKRSLAELLGQSNIARLRLSDSEAVDQIVVIDESTCIGCTKCIQACPVDAIVGATKQMHTVIADHCTGCELCIPPCPVDCIDIVRLEPGLERWRWSMPTHLGSERRNHPRI
ncbi:MAG: electron transport complex subunit RsxB [Proteobacteria bacterium]|nr:electron transport complex subunit RsxB [Pseudomonadota bacterium]